MNNRNDDKCQSHAEGLNVRGRTEKREFKKKDSHPRSKSRTKRKCYHCHKEGHIKRFCPERQQKKNDERKENVDVAISEDGYDSADVLLVSNESTEKEWILDSGCTFHTTPNKDWFEKIKFLNGGKVLLGNNKSCTEPGSLKGSLVIMKWIRKHGIYTLLGSTVIGLMTNNTEAKVDKTTLWHRRLDIVKRLRIDNGLEYCFDEFEKFCKAEGIARHKIVPGTTQQNGLAERFNTTLLERTRCPSASINFKTPEEIWSRHPPDLTRLKVFGCIASAHVKQDKQEPRALKCIFLGYPEGTKGYKLWCLEHGVENA
ncbi:hypothetical protein BUALT_Bualt05G0083000 [Buddleja alternifolia]|uniref:Retrovirus-related Pol polyprotein from transposon TNT 1-94 n=1 Tax=Buddleja alternifolia TaxID=168488 RepID=A0AAV6XTQ0_9LAMI|nr:hypothetical protein BUALT_Bualt05G0083000 [Buddleja alternifolia]